MKHFFVSLPRNILGCFQGRLILWHLAAIGLTAGFVLSGFDWSYFCAMRGIVARHWWQPALPAGMFLPVLVPFTLLICAAIISHARMSRLGWMIGQAALIGWLISSGYKFFTGRAHPAHTIGADISREFRFGFGRGGVFWGWPSSHTTVAFAMAAAIFVFFPKQRWLGVVAMIYAFYIGISVSMTIHWFSDFVAGTIIGTVVGVVVGRSFSKVQAAN